MAIYVPIVMYGLRLLFVVLQELHCLPNCLHACVIRVKVAITSPSFVTLYLVVSEIAKTCLVVGYFFTALPEAVDCYFTRTIVYYCYY